MSDFIVLKREYGKKHIYGDVLGVSIEQYNDGRDLEVWGISKHKEPDETFKTVRAARRFIRGHFNDQ